LLANAISTLAFKLPGWTGVSSKELSNTSRTHLNALLDAAELVAFMPLASTGFVP
jgi:hypothetical protein